MNKRLGWREKSFNENINDGEQSESDPIILEVGKNWFN